MSIRLMTAVWDHARVNGGTLIVLLAMADWANDDGTGVYPTQETLAAKARLGDRQVRNCLAALEEAGYIERDGKRGQRINWRVESDPANIADRKPISGTSGTEVPTEPSEEPPRETSSLEDEQDRESNVNTQVPGDGREAYAEPKTPGASAAPWMVLELARLMRSNDPQAKLPVGLRPLMAPEYASGLAAGSFVSSDARRELLVRGWHKSVKPWLDAIRLLIDADGRPAREVAKVLRWSQEDDFWRQQIKSTTNLRKHYEKMRERALIEYGVSAAPADRSAATSSQLDAIAGRGGDCPECGVGYGSEHLPHCAKRKAA